MKITWLGHACFALEQDGYRLVIDPYEGVDGYPALHTGAHAVFCSHEHHDHNYRAGVALLPAEKSPFTVREIASFHDGAGGALRGDNRIRCFSAGGVTVCHLGDLGHLLSGEQLRAIGAVDVLLLPVGGVYTIDAAQAFETVTALAPRCAVPMHYYHAPCGLPVLAGVEPFLDYFPSERVHRLAGNAFETAPELSGVAVPSQPAF